MYQWLIMAGIDCCIKFINRLICQFTVKGYYKGMIQIKMNGMAREIDNQLLISLAEDLCRRV